MGEPEVTIRWAGDPHDVSSALALREQVFCGEQGVPPSEEVDRLDEQAMHVVALVPGEPRVIGTLRLLSLGEQVKLGRVAVAREWRRRGIATRMIDLALARARDGGARRARLASQLGATELYEHAGFAVESEPFKEAGIDHVWMGLTLAAERPQAAEATTDEISGVLPS
jgi:predicted GNAT family N-acyltransferase